MIQDDPTLPDQNPPLVSIGQGTSRRDYYVNADGDTARITRQPERDTLEIETTYKHDASGGDVVAGTLFGLLVGAFAGLLIGLAIGGAL